MNSLGALSLLFAVVSAGQGDLQWQELAPGVWRQESIPAAYALVDGRDAIVIGAPPDLDLAALEKQFEGRAETILLTHAHRDSTAAAARLVADKRTVRAPKLSEPWLSPAGVAKYWSDSVVMPIENPPLRHRRWAQWYYFVLRRGVDGVRCDVVDGDVMRCGKWTVKAVATPGHSPDHMSYLATHAERKERIVFCGDAFSRSGILHTPFTAEWHHQQPDGLNAAAESLRRIAALQPTLLCPEHGEALKEKIDAALARTAEAIRRAAVAKGYDTWLAASGRKVPSVEFLAPDQVGSATADGNTKPWTKLSPHLYLSGNTYAIASRDGSVLLVDPYHRALPGKLADLKRDHGVGPVEVMTITHAHNDHYTGVFAVPEKDRPPVWALDKIADVIEDPDRVRAPYVDPRPVPIARRLRDGEEVVWREYKLKFHHHPGQTTFTMGLELELDGRRVVFTGDNFYRHDQYSGSGGWSGHNRGLPAGYIRTIERIITMKPDWILAEHGGAMEYSAEDFAARLAWAKEAAAAADALSASGDHRRDWNPHPAAFDPEAKLAAGRKKASGEP
jgi:glyoxylase-like metal-dependent hydrolase (beta-lactamase superfamily II)